LTADSVHHALLIAAAVCLLIGIPSSLCLRPQTSAAPHH
jgi:hypothetical protein